MVFSIFILAYLCYTVGNVVGFAPVHLILFISLAVT